ncbi:GH36-type glycosyl hydrolase domain-containing protein [Paraliobacillus sp. JSM ZJ581]|uniref:GH36-type glycosyl hydrolase domain-containing protein n=1 Tax=Paraliobacillus sp. JSM ZJ581 TaxID=3342118 RepID=UPI0035A94E91
MIETTITNSTQLKAADLQFTFLNSGDILEATYKNVMVNQWVANPVDGSLNNLYLRVHRDNKIQVTPLLGVNANSKVAFAEDQVIWTGSFDVVDYEVRFHLTEHGVWFWEVNLDGNGVEVEVIYGQDIGIADKGAVRNNEAYLAQYIDHSVYEDSEFGYVVCSRQNQGQSTGFPYLQQGSLTKSVGYSTDGYQFFGLSYKETNQPEIAIKDLPNEVYQYEFAYTGLQSEKVCLDSNKQFVFYGLFAEDHKDAVIGLEYKDVVEKAWNEIKEKKSKTRLPVAKVSRQQNIGEPLKTDTLTMEEIEAYYPIRHHEEWDGDTLLSFFTANHEHVVLKEKELVVERPHGHILMSGNNHKLNENTITTTTFMYGIFNAQLVIGNTNFNKMMSNARNALNIMKTSGQRIYVEVDGCYHLLTMPSCYEIGFNYTRWYYKTATDTIVITTYTIVDSPEVHLHVRSENGKENRYLVTNQVTLNTNEQDVPFQIERQGKEMIFTAHESSDSANIYPDLSYRLDINGASFEVAGEEKLVTNVEKNTASLVVFEINPSNEWNIAIQGSLEGKGIPFSERHPEKEIVSYRDYYKKVMNGFSLTKDGKTIPEINKVNTLAWWYTHNMLVHFSVPHGLEQYGGAAWGTRDVCQGPVEYFMTTQKYDIVKEIIKTVFMHQFEDDGNWPQWFMFDKYSHIKAGESHGDIIVWPLKVLADYLAVTGDYAILDEKVPYTKRGTHVFTEESYTIYDHAKKEIAYIKEHFLHGTHLSSYGDGDWDDTLQPANAQLKQYMVSSWTVALTYQVFDKLSSVLDSFDRKDAEELRALADGIEEDFNKYMLDTGVVPGFIYMEDPEEVELMLHPHDQKTGINYRLLPMQRSIISELFTKEQAEQHYRIIRENLYCPDGVRLMNRPANYKGGISTHFQRAETAANFGREIGLHYVHAHIRFVEAMAKLGKKEEVWSGLEKINPVGIQAVVPNAERRQSNAYFSSSDGMFPTRYDAQDNFDKLRDGSVKVKGGWRIYSSGPGIYMNQLISNGLGIRPKGGGVIIDPVLPDAFDGLEFHFQINNMPVTFIYHLGNNDCRVSINGKQIQAKRTENRYRQTGVYISKEQLESNLDKQRNVIEIYC